MKKILSLLLVLLWLAPSALAATTGERNALNKAHSYLSHMSFTRTRLIEQLEYSGFTAAQAAYGARMNGY